MSTDLARREITPLETRPSIVSTDEWSMLAQIANTIALTEFVPKGLRGNKAAVMACLLFGREQGLGPMTALKEVAMVDGKPTMSAALMAAKIRAAGHSLRRREVRDNAGNLTATTAVGKRGDNGDEDTFTFSLEMAARAGLANKQNWKNYPEAMMWARAVSQLARTLFSDVFIGSVYTAEELGAPNTDEDGQVLEAALSEPESHDARGDPAIQVSEEGVVSSSATKVETASGSESEDIEGYVRSPVDEPASEAQKKKLNVLYGQLTKKPNEHRKDGIVAAAGGMQGEDWKTARDRLTKGQAHDLIEMLQRFEENAKREEAAGDPEQDELPI